VDSEVSPGPFFLEAKKAFIDFVVGGKSAWRVRLRLRVERTQSVLSYGFFWLL